MRLSGADRYHFGFSRHDGGNGYPSAFTGKRYWEIPRQEHGPARVLSGNEHASEWRFGAGQPLFVAVTLQVADTNTASTADALTVLVIHVHAGAAVRDTARVSVPWSMFHRRNHDTLFLSMAPIAFRQRCDRGSDSLLCEVWGGGAVTTRIESVVIEDEPARDMFTYYDIGPVPDGDTLWRSRLASIRDSLTAELNSPSPGDMPCMLQAETPWEIPVTERSAAGMVRAFVGRPFRPTLGAACAPAAPTDSAGRNSNATIHSN